MVRSPNLVRRVSAQGDLDERIRNLPSAEQVQLREALRSTVGADLQAEEDARLSKIRQIVVRGKIRDDSELRHTW